MSLDPVIVGGEIDPIRIGPPDPVPVRIPLIGDGAAGGHRVGGGQLPSGFVVGEADARAGARVDRGQHEAAVIVGVGGVAAERARRKMLERHAVERVVGVADHRPVAPGEARAVVVGVIAISFEIGRVDHARRGLGREIPGRAAIEAVIGELRLVAVGVGDELLLAVGRVGVGYLVALLARHAERLLHLQKLADRIIEILRDAVGAVAVGEPRPVFN